MLAAQLGANLRRPGLDLALMDPFFGNLYGSRPLQFQQPLGFSDAQVSLIQVLPHGTNSSHASPGGDVGIDSKEAGTRLSYRLYEELTTTSRGICSDLVDEDLKQLVVTRIRDDQVSLPVKDDPLRVIQLVDQDDICFFLCCDQMDGGISQSNSKDIAI